MIIKKKQLSSPSIWLTVYGDWITNLTLFFILLFATALIASQKGMDSDEMNKLRDSVSKAIFGDENKKTRETETSSSITEIPGITGVFIGEGEMRIVLPDTILFDPGKAKLKPESERILTEIGAMLARMPHQIIVEGHTCDVPVKQRVPAGMARWEIAMSRSTGLGPYQSNWELSAARSIQVINFLTGHGIIEPGRLVAGACGPSDPVEPNTDEENRVRNRRIEFRVITES